MHRPIQVYRLSQTTPALLSNRRYCTHFLLKPDDKVNWERNSEYCNKKEPKSHADLDRLIMKQMILNATWNHSSLQTVKQAIKFEADEDRSFKS